jgi:fatty acid desaturase
VSGVVTDPNWDATPCGPARGLSAKELAGLSPVRPVLEIVGTWAVIALTVASYLRWPSVPTFVLAFVIIASRQYALLILMHDAFHSLLHPNRRVNDAVGAFLIGAPCGSSYWGPRAGHLEHHRKLGETDDPEFFLHSAGPPRDKRTLGRLAWHFLRLIAGGQVLYTHVNAGTKDTGRSTGQYVIVLVRKLPAVAAAQLVLLAAFWMLGSWTAYFTLWLLPLTTLTVFLNALRAFCDHANPADTAGREEDRLISYVSNPIERFFVAPFHMNYHAEHHMFPYVPHYRLPALRAKIRRSEPVVRTIQWRGTYVAFVREFLRAQRSAPAAGA